MSGDDAFLRAFERLPVGTFEGLYAGKRWIATRSQIAQARADKLVAEARDGSDYVSMNLYRLGRGLRLAPCEMPEAKVRAFVHGLEVVRATSGIP